MFEKEELGHGKDHIERMMILANIISKDEDADLDIVNAAILLHDIARKNALGEKEDHAALGAKLAQKILPRFGFSQNKIEIVVDAINNHRYSKGVKPKTKEAQVLQDVDRLDAIGAVGVMRMLRFAGKTGEPVHDESIKPNKKYLGGHSSKTVVNHFYEKISKIEPESFNTTKAKSMAKERSKFINDYFARFIKELRGEL